MCLCQLGLLQLSWAGQVLLDDPDPPGWSRCSWMIQVLLDSPDIPGLSRSSWMVQVLLDYPDSPGWSRLRRNQQPDPPPPLQTNFSS